jgi:LuxR family maltose regulon positive regulatory protein
LENLPLSSAVEPPKQLPAPARGSLPDELTEREVEILDCMMQGFSNQEIAGRLVLSLGTVKWYTSQIYAKLQVRSRTQAVAKAREMGIL